MLLRAGLRPLLPRASGLPRQAVRAMAGPGSASLSLGPLPGACFGAEVTSDVQLAGPSDELREAIKEAVTECACPLPLPRSRRSLPPLSPLAAAARLPLLLLL